MKYQIAPHLSETDYAALKADIAARGVLVPVELDEEGNVLDGHHRLKACTELGITQYPKLVRKGLSEDEKRQHARQLNLARRHLTQEQKRALIAEQLKETPEKSNNSIAQGLGVDDKTVGAVRQQLVDGSEIPNHEEIIGRDGVKQPARKIRTAYVDDSETKPFVKHNTGNNEWYTPPEYIEAARAVMGAIELDPASSEAANRIVKANVFYTKEEDGLTKPWSRCVWMNPPYASDLIGRFTTKLVASLDDIDQACVLVNNATETGWFQDMLERCDGVCFPRGRIKFIDMDGVASGAPLQGQAVLYFGANVAGFRREFECFGVVL